MASDSVTWLNAVVELTMAFLVGKRGHNKSDSLCK